MTQQEMAALLRRYQELLRCLELTQTYGRWDAFHGCKGICEFGNIRLQKDFQESAKKIFDNLHAEYQKELNELCGKLSIEKDS